MAAHTQPREGALLTAPRTLRVISDRCHIAVVLAV